MFADLFQPVTLTLRKGTSGNLQDVETITDQGKDGTFTWTPGSNIKEGETYAFQVTQDGERNYSALLTAAAPANPPAPEATQTATSSATAPMTGTMSMSTGEMTGTSSRALISSSASGTPSSTPTSSSATSSISAEAPFGTDDTVMNGKAASETGSVQSSASVSRYSVGLAAGAMAVLFYIGF